MMEEMIDSIIFDLDGTLWDSQKRLLLPLIILKEKYPNVTDEVTVRSYKVYLEDHYMKLQKNCCKYQRKGHIRLLMIVVIMRRNIWRNMEQSFFDGLEETLQELKSILCSLLATVKKGIFTFLYISPFRKYFIIMNIRVDPEIKGDNIRMVVERII